MNSAIISFEHSRFTDKEIAQLLEKCGYGLAAEYLQIQDFSKKFFCPGTITAVAIHDQDQRLIGISRAFTDNITTTYLAEICVIPPHRHKGIESQLVRAITIRCQHTAIFSIAFSDELYFLNENSITEKAKIIACSRGPKHFRPAHLTN
ncbi:GNAT family N-acetyltransferase [Variovorax boronicumulans]|uniref:GNAT family N-acetyltransferase n=1 Tax=Variovorax boronicumulans TaxID=436515 RepID=UPI001C59A0AB